MNSRQNGGIVGKIFGSLFFTIFFLAGAYFTYQVVLGFLHTLNTRNWTKTPASIESVSITRNQKHVQDNTPYELSLKYSYTFGSKTYQKHLAPEENRYSMYEYAAELAEEYPEGSTQECFVNPNEPSQAVLYLESLLVGFVILFPLLFVAIGLGGLYFLWLYSPSPMATSNASIARSKTASDKTGARVFWGVGITFSIVGFAGCYYFAHSMFQTLNAQTWVETPATVIESAVITHESDNDDGGTSYTYSVDIFYEYEFGGRSFKASQYDLVGGSSSGYDSKKNIVDEHPPGTEFTVFVNPSDPSEAAVSVEFSWFFLIILFPLIFLIIGLGTIYSQIGGSSSRSRSSSFASTGSSSFDPSADTGKISNQTVGSVSLGPEILKPHSSPLGKVLGSLFLCAFWNGIVSIFVYQAYSAWEAGNPEWFLMVFLTPFVLIGLLLVFAVIYSFLAFFNPIVELTVSTRSPRIGSEINVTWKTKGNASKMNSLILALEVEEEVRYRRGTDTITDRHTIYEKEISKTTSTSMIQAGSTRIEIPEDAMHSFEANSNKIIWKLHLRGDIPKWPDIGDTYNLNVLPKAVQ